VTEIRVTAVPEDGGGTQIVWEDDGVGIPYAIKNRIFDRGVGSHTGLGLFLVREILSITGISIRETGVPGEGARFEILVPGGCARIG
jgi:signal transduction histidine kinase